MTTTRDTEAADEAAELPDDAGSAAEPETPEPEMPEPRARRQRAAPGHHRLITLAVAAALALTALGAWFTIEANGLRDSEAATNAALVDTETGDEVQAAVTSSINRIFSYSPDTLERTERAARDVLRGKALDSYMKLFNRVSELAPRQRVAVTARVVHSAVTYLGDGEAELLVFLDQTAKRAGEDSPAASAAHLWITARRAASGWVITKLAIS